MLAVDDALAATEFATSLAVIAAGWATLDEVRAAVAWRRKAHPQLEKLAVIQGKLTPAQVAHILNRESAEGFLFEQIALQLGLLTQSELSELLNCQASLTPSLADALVILGTITPEQAESIIRQASEAAHGEPAIF